MSCAAMVPVAAAATRCAVPSAAAMPLGAPAFSALPPVLTAKAFSSRMSLASWMRRGSWSAKLVSSLASRDP